MSEWKKCLKLVFAKIPTRLVLYFLCLTCTMISYMLRSVINLTLLAMVKANSSEGEPNYGGHLKWSSDVQYHVLTSFYWTYTIASLAGGIAVHKFGSKMIIGGGVLVAALCNMCIPLASEVTSTLVIILQLLQGFGQGLLWPAIYGMVGWWIPLYERSRFLSCFQGLSIGVTLSQFMSGFVIAYIGWQYVFYFSGIFGLIWCAGWYFLAHDTPELHPKIAETELHYIIESRGQMLRNSKRQIPWKAIILSLPVWSITISTFGRKWMLSVILVYGPTYLKSAIGLTVEMNGFWSSITSFLSFLSALCFSHISDAIARRKIMSTLANRKLFTGIGQIISAFLFILLSHYYGSLTLVLVMWASLQIFISASLGGVAVNTVDIAPNFSGPVTSVVQFVSSSPNILSTLVTKILLKNERYMESWRHIFYINSAVLLGTYLFYFTFASADVAKWDKYESEHENEELQTLKPS